MKLDVIAFMRRFLLHILPKRFTKIRYYGFLGNVVKLRKIQFLKELFQVPTDTDEEENQLKDWICLMIYLTGKDPTVCPLCKKGHLQRMPLLPLAMAPPIAVSG
jgi:hypothetical protein